MFKFILLAALPFLLLLGESFNWLMNEPSPISRPENNGILEKLVVSEGNVTFDLDISAVQASDSGKRSSRNTSLKFSVSDEAFFTIVVFNNELRGPLPSAMKLVPSGKAVVPTSLAASINDLILESNAGGSDYDLTIRDGKSGFPLFNIVGATFEYEPNSRSLTLQDGKLMPSNEFAAQLGIPSTSGMGKISLSATTRQISVTQIVEGEVVSDSMPAQKDPEVGTVPGPDVVVGNLFGLAQFGEDASIVGLAVGTDSCNFGTVDLNWLALPNNDHPVIPQNLYRMSGGGANDERFEQIGQSSVKHAFTALTENICGLGCNGVGSTKLGSGCSDPYTADLNEGPSLGSRSWINPFTGAYPRGDSATPPNNHTGHNHASGPLHRILTPINDLTPAANPGATYYAEAQYITPHEYAHCQANPTQCNMYNNVSYRRYNVTGGNGSAASRFTFSPPVATERMKPAILAWTGATSGEFRPEPGTDGVGIIAYKVTNPSPGVWHYEYALYNQNLDRAIQSFAVPIGAEVVLSNVGFHAPPQQAGWSGDGTVGNTGFSNAPWAQSQAGGAMTWSSETLAQNPNANAIRWGTMYNFRFDSNRAPTAMNATIGFFKTGAPINVQVQGPSSSAPTIATISGRVTSANGRGVGGARVSITGTGVNRIAITSSFGYYMFESIPTGSMYTISPKAKRYTFTPQNLLIADSISGVNFVGVP